MAGEMSKSEVTRDAYPTLFDLMDELALRGIESEPRPFDQYQGPYLKVNGGIKVWLGEQWESLLIEHGFQRFETDGASFVSLNHPGQIDHGVYSVDEAADQIEKIIAS